MTTQIQISINKTPDAVRFEGERRDRDDTADDTSANQRGEAAFHVLKTFGSFRRKASLDCFFVFFVVKIFCCGLRPRPGIVFGCVVLACTPRGGLFAQKNFLTRNTRRVIIISNLFHFSRHALLTKSTFPGSHHLHRRNRMQFFHKCS